MEKEQTLNQEGSKVTGKLLLGGGRSLSGGKKSVKQGAGINGGRHWGNELPTASLKLFLHQSRALTSSCPKRYW